MKTLGLTRVSNTLHQQSEKLLDPDRAYVGFTAISLIARFALNFSPLKNYLNGYSQPGITFLVTTFLTFSFILFCYIKKVDWYGQQKKDIVPAVRKWSRKNKIRKILFFPFLSVFDPFLLFIYLKNGSTKIWWKLFTLITTLLSLLGSSYIWLYLGRANEQFGILPFALAGMILFIYYPRIKKWAEKY